MGGTGQILGFGAVERYLELIPLGAPESLEGSGGHQSVIVKAVLASARRGTAAPSVCLQDAVMQGIWAVDPVLSSALCPREPRELIEGVAWIF